MAHIAAHRRLPGLLAPPVSRSRSTRPPRRPRRRRRVANGAIFQAANGYAPLTSGQRAAQVGDVITIALVERTQGTSTSTSATDHNGSIGLTPPTTGPLALFPATDAAAMGGNSTFAGQGQTGQSNSLVGEISVAVAEVCPTATCGCAARNCCTSTAATRRSASPASSGRATSTSDNRVASTRRRRCADRLCRPRRDLPRQPPGLAAALLLHSQPVLR